MRQMDHRNVNTTAVYIDANENLLPNAVELVRHSLTLTQSVAAIDEEVAA